MVTLRNCVTSTLVSSLWLAACGGYSSSSPSGAGPVQTPSSITLVLSTAGVSPKHGSVRAAGSVTIVNQDSVAHQLTSSRSDQQMDCPELNTPILAPGDQFMATAANQNEACGFADNLHPADSNFQGTLSVVSSGTMPTDGNGGGY